MKVAGIVAEYNPFHKGHAYQIQKIREILGEDTGVVCVMSGDFVQRGEPAVFSKYARAEAAVRCGADLVIELPVSYSLASAERFAEGAVHILGKLGGVDYLVFGSESGDLDGIVNTAELLLTEEFHTMVKAYLESGCSYPTARASALRDLSEGDTVVATPNDNLGVEYVKAIKRYGYKMQPIVVKRVGAMHDCDYDGEMKSGSEIREIIRQGNAYSAYVPERAFEVYASECAAGRGPVSLNDLETAVISRLRMLDFGCFANLPDAAEGLEQKLYAACRRESYLTDIYDSVKSKRYTHARIRRMTMGAALGITKEDYSEENVFARVLALNGRGGSILRMCEPQCAVEVISKPANGRKLDEPKKRLFEKGASAHDLYVLAYGCAEQRKGETDWQTSPIFVK